MRAALGIQDLSPPDERAERISGSDGLAEEGEVRDCLRVIHGEELPRPSEAGLDLVRSEHYAVPIAELSEPGEEIIRGDYLPCDALDRLDEDARDVVGR